jgi:hypothetical protein
MRVIKLLKCVYAACFLALLWMAHAGDDKSPSASGIEFDTLIRYRQSESHPEADIFVHYWVSSDYYQAVVIWSEPSGRGLFLNPYPPTLTITSDLDSFSIHHDLYPKLNETFQRPFGPRPAFAYRYGDYSIATSRFADSDARRSRVVRSDLFSLERSSKGGSNIFQGPFKDSDESGSTSDLYVKASAHGEKLEKLEYFRSRKPVKTIQFDYDASGRQLRAETIRFPERQVEAELSGKGLQIVVTGNTNYVKRYNVTALKGGREKRVTFGDFEFNGKKIAVPLYVEIIGPMGNLLQSAEITNIKPTSLPVDGIQKAVRELNAATEKYQIARQTISKHWDEIERRNNVGILKQTEQKQIQDLIDYFSAQLGPEKSIGERLRTLNLLIGLNRTIGATAALLKVFAIYLDTIESRLSAEMTISGGNGVVETSVFSQNWIDADDLLDYWLTFVEAHQMKPQIINQFAATQIEHGNQWIAWRLTKALLKRSDLSSADRFEASALFFIAMNGLTKASRVPASKSSFAQWQDSRFQKVNAKMRANELQDAISLSVEIKEPTARHDELRKQLTLIKAEVMEEKGEFRKPSNTGKTEVNKTSVLK